MKLLHIDASIQGDASASRAIGAAIVERLRASDPDAEVSYRDLVAEPIGHLTLDGLADLAGNDSLQEFLAADVVVIGAPLYNFTISSQLKTWLDRIVVAGQTFRYGAAGAEGLAGDKRVIVALARGNVYSGESPHASLEHAETLLRTVLSFIGVTAPEFVIAEGLALGEEPRRAGLAAAYERVERLEPVPEPA
jgi:FMN-dependent NADH-azoreductase